MTDATQKGAPADQTDTSTLDTQQQNAQHPAKERSHPLSQREALLAKHEEYRKANQPEAENPGDLGAGPVKEAATEEETESKDGLEPVQPTVTDEVESYIVKDEAGKAFFKTVVDGQEKLVPLDRARAQLQKHEAAEIRLQTASQRARELDEREQKIREQEQKAQTRPPSATDASVLDDAALEAEAAGLVKSLIEDDEADAAKKLAAVLKKARSSGSQVDKETLVKEVATVITAKQTEEQQQKALAEGFNAYLKEYSETPVEKDPALRAWHAAKVDALALEHPEWSPKECMLKAGEMALEFAGIKRGSQASDEGNTPPADARQTRKQQLQPVPQSRSARSGTERPAQSDTSPQSALNEMRKARGQPVIPSQRGG
jgi:hypothetical protein